MGRLGEDKAKVLGLLRGMDKAYATQALADALKIPYRRAWYAVVYLTMAGKVRLLRETGYWIWEAT